jgi:hypothetical protein
MDPDTPVQQRVPNFNQLAFTLVCLILQRYRQMLGDLVLDRGADLLCEFEADLLLDLWAHMVCDLTPGVSGWVTRRGETDLFFEDVLDNVFDIRYALFLFLVLGAQLSRRI